MADHSGNRYQTGGYALFRIQPHHFNIFVDIFVKRNDGSGVFDKFDWSQFNCGVNALNGRFPILSKDLSQKTAQQGKITYRLPPSTGWNLFFSTKTLKMKIWIQDRAFHRSKVIETPEFTLASVRKSS